MTVFLKLGVLFISQSLSKNKKYGASTFILDFLSSNCIPCSNPNLFFNLSCQLLNPISILACPVNCISCIDSTSCLKCRQQLFFDGVNNICTGKVFQIVNQLNLDIIFLTNTSNLDFFLVWGKLESRESPIIQNKETMCSIISSILSNIYLNYS